MATPRGGTQARRDFEALTRSFFDGLTTAGSHPDRSSILLASVLLVVDVRHPGLAADLAALSWAQKSGYPLLAVATKADRISRAARLRASKAHAEALAGPLGRTVPLVAVSIRTTEGIGQVWQELKRLL